MVNPSKLPKGLEEIRLIALKYFCFKRQKHNIDRIIREETNNGNEYLHRIRSNQTGRCRLRAIAFIDEIQKLNRPDIYARIVENGLHAFVEIKDKKKCQIKAKRPLCAA